MSIRHFVVKWLRAFIVSDLPAPRNRPMPQRRVEKSVSQNNP